MVQCGPASEVIRQAEMVMAESPPVLVGRPPTRYGFAVVAVLLAVAVRWALEPVLGERFPFLTFFAAVLVTAWVAGVGPSALAAVLGGAAGAFLFVQPRFSFPVDAGADQTALAVYALVAAGVVLFGRSMRRTAEAADRDRRRLVAEASERKRVESLLERYRLLAEHTSDIVLFVRPDGSIAGANAAAAAAYGYDLDTLLALSITDLRASHTRAEIPGQLAAADESGLAFETVHRRKDGSTFPAEVSSRGADVAGERLVMSIVRDVTDRKKAADALRESEARFRAVMEQSPFSTQVLAPDGRTRWVNRSWEELWGVTLDQLTDYNMLEDKQLVAKGVMPFIRRGFAGEAVVIPAIEYDPNETIPDRTRHADPKRWVSAVIYPLKDERGRVREVVLIHDDITARRRTEAALREREAVLRTLGDNLPAGAIYQGVVEPGGGRHVAYVSAGIERLLGVRPDEVLADAGVMYSLILPEDAPRVRAAEAAALAADASFDCEFRSYTSTGEVRWLHARSAPRPLPDGTTVWDGVLMDVTARKRAEEAFARSRETLELAQDAARAGTFEWNIRTDEVNWSGSEERLYGLPPGGFGGRYENWRRAVHPDDLDRAEAEVRAAARGGAPLDTEFRIVRPDGEVRWVAARGRVFPGPDGRPERMVGINIDITDWKAAEEALKVADRRKDEFLATLAHELRNPLAPIRNALKILQLAGGDPAAAASARAVMERQVAQMVRLIDDLLDVSRITRNRVVLRRGPVPLGEVVDLAMEHSRPALETGGHALTVSLPQEPLVLDADSARVVQVLTNLLHNAAKYTPPGGRVALAAERDGPAAVVRVSDNGIGIAATDLARIFEPFAQAGRVPGRLPDGLGVGLTLVKSLVELHGGSVVAASDGPGKGSTFTVRLPLAAPPADRSAEAPPPTPRPRARRVLVVDDMRDSGDSLGTLLRLYGMEVCVAHDGRSALDAAREFRPDVVLLDVGLPGMDGLEVARQLRADPHTRSAALVAVTGFGQDEDRRKTREAGFDLHLVKPVEPDELRRVLSALPEPDGQNGVAARL
jgi:PAS domain S-box-containing protein